MKKMVVFLLFFVVLHQGNAQQLQSGEAVPAQKFLDIVETTDKYWANLFSDNYLNGTDRFDKGYEVVDLANSKRWVSGPIHRRSEKLIGEPIKFFIKNDFIFELVRFFKPVATIKFQLGILKRNLHDFKQVGDIAWLGEYPNPMFSPNVVAYPDAQGITVLSGDQTKPFPLPFIVRYDYNLNLIWKKELELLADPKNYISGYTSDDLGRGLIEVRSGEEWTRIDSFEHPPSTLSFIAVDANGDITVIAPDLKQSDIVFSAGKFHFDFDRKELTGVGLIGKPDDYRFKPDAFGYAYLQCSADGVISVFHHQMFTYDDLYDAEAKAYAARTGYSKVINGSDPFPMPQYPYFKAIRKDNGTFIVMVRNLSTERDYLSDKNPPLARSVFFFEVDKVGKLAWKKLLIEPPLKPEVIIENRTNPGIYNDFFVLNGQKLTWFSYVPKARFVNGKYTLSEEAESLKDKEEAPVLITMDCANGGNTEYQELFPNVTEGLKFDAFFASGTPGEAKNRPVFLFCTDKKRNNAQFVKVTLANE